MIIKNYDNFFNKYKLIPVNESISMEGFKIIPEGSSIPISGRVKWGVDSTGDQLHLGHMIGMHMVKKLKEAGCEVHIIIGTYTSVLGDPSGRSAMRPMISPETAKSNGDNLISQIKRVIGDDITIHYNHEWFDKMTMTDMLKIISKYSIDFLMSRDAFQKRSQGGSPVYTHEILVPMLQGIDSYQISADIEVGGTDQLFNFMLSRDIQEKLGQKPEICLLAPVINGTNGSQKMSKSYNNCIFINDIPKDVFGKVMSISDETMYQWIPLFMDNYDPKGHPMELKKKLAVEITNEIWGEGKGQEELEAFTKQFQKGVLPKDISEYSNSDIISFISLVIGGSKGDARRLLQQGAVSIIRDGGEFQKITDVGYKLEPGDIIKAGKRNYGKVI